jgi:hypothetical protein
MSEPVNLPESFSLVSSDLFSRSISGPTTLGSIAESSSQIVRCTLQGVVEVMSCSRYSRPFQSSPIRYYPCASSHPVLIGVIHDPSIPAVQMAHIESQTCPSPLRFAFRSTYTVYSAPLASYSTFALCYVIRRLSTHGSQRVSIPYSVSLLIPVPIYTHSQRLAH